MHYTVEIPQLKPLQEAFAKAPSLVASEIIRSGNRSLVRYQATARERAPIDKGQLRSSIQIQPMTRTANRIEGSVGTGLKYAIWQEAGTGIYGPTRTPIRPRRAKVLAFTVGGKQVFARQVRGSRPRWFMRGSLEHNRHATLNDFSQALENVVRQIGGSR
jgi:hypothetical protein